MTALDAALALAEQGLPCFPVRENKAPSCPNGFRAATADPAGLTELWRRYPGPLIGVPTGETSGIDVLDVDGPKHAEAAGWWAQIQSDLPWTRLHRTRSGGVHALFRHESNLRCWTARPVPGIDGRGDGGFAIWWPAAGGPVLQDAPLAPWPTWLLSMVRPPRPAIRQPWIPPALKDRNYADRYATAALRHAADRVARAAQGSRNDVLNAETFALGRFIAAGMLHPQTVADRMAAAALRAGLGEREITLTLASALSAAGVA